LNIHAQPTVQQPKQPSQSSNVRRC
jgi:hypothetical protein